MKKAFTLMELVIVVIVVGILATLGYPAYKNTIENANIKVCLANQETLKSALDIYVMENDEMPGGLSQLPSETIRRAYAQVMQQKGAWKIKLAYFIVGLRERGLAYAVTLSAVDFKKKLAHEDWRLLTCPDDARSLTERQATGGSYGLWKDIAGISSRDYKALSDDTILIGDCNTSTFTDQTGTGLSRRHPRYGVLSSETKAYGKRKDGKNVERTESTLSTYNQRQ